jgi:hypothetical protein
MKEKMDDTTLMLEQILERTGITKQWEIEAEAEVRGFLAGEKCCRIEIAKRALALGLTFPLIQRLTDVDEEAIDGHTHSTLQ